MNCARPSSPAAPGTKPGEGSGRGRPQGRATAGSEIIGEQTGLDLRSLNRKPRLSLHVGNFAGAANIWHGIRLVSGMLDSTSWLSADFASIAERRHPPQPLATAGTLRPACLSNLGVEALKKNRELQPLLSETTPLLAARNVGVIIILSATRRKLW